MPSHPTSSPRQGGQKGQERQTSEPTLAPSPVSASRATMSELMMPHMANNLGHVFGGEILSLVDRVAAVAAIRHARRPCVTVSVDRVDFHEPIQLGELVVAYASVNYVGRTSMEVGVRIEAEHLLSGRRRHVAAEARRRRRLEERQSEERR